MMNNANPTMIANKIVPKAIDTKIFPSLSSLASCKFFNKFELLRLVMGPPMSNWLLSPSSFRDNRLVDKLIEDFGPHHLSKNFY